VDDVPAPVCGNMYGHNEIFLKYIRLSEVETNLKNEASRRRLAPISVIESSLIEMAKPDDT
jgi:hypothetical protein